MTPTKRLGGLFAAAVVAVLAFEACNGFGTNCSTNADCQALNPSGICDPTLKVCFLYGGPTVVSIEPDNQAVGVVPLNAEVVATFSEVIADAGVSENFAVFGQGFQTPGGYLITVDAGLSVASFVPTAGGLALGTDYAVFLDGGIADLSGRPLLPFSSTFTTRDGVFTSGGSLRYTTQTGLFALAANYLGNVVTQVTLLLPGTTTADFLTAAGVSAPGAHPTTTSPPLQQITGFQASNPAVGIAYDGTGFAAWTSQTTTGTVSFTGDVSVWNPAAQTWSPPQELAGADTRASYPQVVGFDHGRGVAVWIFEEVLYGSYYKADAGWLGYFPIQTNATLPANPLGTARQLSLASDSIGGDALVAWTSAQASVDAGQILGAFLPSNGTFPPPVPLSNGALPSQQPVVALGYGTAGLGAIVWETASTNSHVFGSTFDPTRANPFSPHVQLDVAITAINPTVGVAANGNAIAIWQEAQNTPDGGTAIAVVSSTYSRATDTWSPPVTLDSDPSYAVYAPAIGVDPGGNAVAAWLKGTDAGAVTPPGCYPPPLGCLQVRGGRYRADGGWHEVTQIGASSDPVYNYAVQVVVDGLGRGWVVDTRNPGNSTLYLEYIPFE